MNKIDELELYLTQEKPDLVGITETWTYEDVQDSEICVEGYTLLRKDRVIGDKIRGGGVALYIKNEFSVTARDDLNEANFPESIWCNIEIGGEKTLVGVCYRPPSKNKICDEAMYKLITRASREQVLIMGDFNFPELDWAKPETLDDSHPFIECVNDNFLFQGVIECTRSSNILDLILTSEENLIDNVSVDEPFGSSDHQTIRFDFIAFKESSTLVENKMHDYFKADYEQMREDSKIINWEGIVMGIDVEVDWNSLKFEIANLRDKYVPYKRNRNSKCKWANKSVVKSRRAKNKAWVKYIDSGKREDMYKKYLLKLKKCSKLSRIAKRNFEQNLAKNVKDNSKSFFSYVRSKQRTKEKVGPLMDKGGEIINEDRLAANLLNQYFSSVFTKENFTNAPLPKQIFQGNMQSEGLLSIEITEEIVANKLEKLDVNKCPGLDDIHPKLLFELRGDLVKPLTKLFNFSIKNGVVPLEWREAGVVPLFKKGKKSEPENYRPVSLTSSICKIIESILKDSILDHLDKFSLIKDSQHGFRKGRSCLTNLLVFMEEITYSLDEGKPVDVIYLDFAKAFDKVPYRRLFSKLRSHGIGGNVAEWIEAWLTNRKQKVGLDKKYSDWSSVVSGVPQGSVLGPLLFLIYINDLDEGITSKLGKFADDTKVARAVSNNGEVDILREDLCNIFQWSVDWQMSFNLDKCTVMHLGSKNPQCEYKMGNNILKKSKQERDLGVIMDSSGKSTEQCIMAVKKANTILGMIKRNIIFKSKDVIVRLYKALVRPKLEYCIQAWCPYLKKDINILEKVQKRATKMIEGYKNMCYEDRLSNTGLIKLEKRRARGDLIQVFKIIKGIDKVDYRHFFEIAVSDRSHKTRGHNLKIIKVGCKSDIRKHFFSQRVVNAWNGLTQFVVDADTVNSFKNRLDKFDRYFVEGN
jgi:ribonuclease P/MRP protein subunit RPP40